MKFNDNKKGLSLWRSHSINKVRNGWIRVTTKGVQSDVPFRIDSQQLATPLEVWTLSL